MILGKNPHYVGNVTTQEEKDALIAKYGNEALRVVRYGKGVLVFWQTPPWTIDADAKPYLRTTKRRANAMLARLMGNLGFVSTALSVRYGDVPVAEDDPYRYYRW